MINKIKEKLNDYTINVNYTIKVLKKEPNYTSNVQDIIGSYYELCNFLHDNIPDAQYILQEIKIKINRAFSYNIVKSDEKSLNIFKRIFEETINAFFN